jgi:hypothetical protein
MARPQRRYCRIAELPEAEAGGTGRDVGGFAGSPSRVRSSRVINVTLRSRMRWLYNGILVARELTGRVPGHSIAGGREPRVKEL